jgi:hypothetical protein
MNFIKRLINEELNKRVNLNEEFIGDDFYVYHVAHQETLSSIFKFGFEAFYTASKVGNAYGRGVYSTFDLKSSVNNAKRGEYGKIILKCRVKSLKNFLIWDTDIARKVYGGHWRVSSQLELICPPNVLNRLKNSNGVARHFWSSGEYIYNSITIPKNWTSHNAHAADWYGEKEKEFGKCFKGLIFNGPHDGNVCVIRDFKNVYPIEYSDDMGRTWKPIKADIKFKDYVLDDIDLKYEVGDLYDDVPFNFTNNFARVKKYNKYNYLYKKTYKNGVISPIWFDSGAETFSVKGDCLVLLNNEKYMLHHRKNTDEFYVLDMDRNFLCLLEDFEGYLEHKDEEDEW